MTSLFEGEFSGAVYVSPLGRLYQADCLDVLPLLPSESVDLVVVREVDR